MLSMIDLFFILLTAVILLIVISLTVALYSATSFRSNPNDIDDTADEESITSSLPNAHMTKWHIGDHLADALPPRSVSSKIEQLSFDLPYHSLGDVTLDASQKHPTLETPVDKTIERSNRAIREMVRLPHKPHQVDSTENENILTH
jgi:hypothetical protein